MNIRVIGASFFRVDKPIVYFTPSISRVDIKLSKRGTTDNLQFRIETLDKWLSITNQDGTLGRSTELIRVEIDRNKVPAGVKNGRLTIKSLDDKTTNLTIPVKISDSDKNPPTIPILQSS